jgi:hypothetical protein
MSEHWTRLNCTCECKGLLKWRRLTLCITGSKVLGGANGETGAGADSLGDVKTAQHDKGSEGNSEGSHFCWWVGIKGCGRGSIQSYVCRKEKGNEGSKYLAGFARD